MPVEIKKLIVKAVVDSSNSSSSYSNGEQGSNHVEINQAELINKCVKQVLQILKQTKQR